MSSKARGSIPLGCMEDVNMSMGAEAKEARTKRMQAFLERSKTELEAEKWEQFAHLGIERVRVLAGWLVRPMKNPELAAYQPITFQPDPPRIVYASPGPSSGRPFGGMDA
jgi:hypothetical protein